MRMELIPLAIFVTALAAALAAALWRFARRAPAESGPFPDVPDAPPTATPTEAPGMTLPYSSVDPYAPPKQVIDRRNAD